MAAVSVTVSIIAFGLFASAGGDTTTTTTTTAPTDSDDNGDAAPDPGDDTQVTLPGDATAPPITPIGERIPVSELVMRADGIGPFAFGHDGDDVLGRFHATFGPPTDDTGFRVGTGSFGECPGQGIRVVQWAPLNLVLRGDASSSQFVSYRMDLRYGGAMSEVTDMATLSGLRVADTVERLEEIYANFDIVFRVHQTLDMTFELRSSPTGEILLWGPVQSQAADSQVTGIYSPDSCRPTG